MLPQPARFARAAQILRIMKDSRCGTYALVGMGLVLHLKLHAIAAIAAAGTTSAVVRALVVAHTTSRWTALPLLYCCTYIQDEEDAKRGLYNWFAQSKRLLTLPRLCLGTATAVAVPWLLLSAQQAAATCAVTLAVTVAAGLYAHQIIGGVVVSVGQPWPAAAAACLVSCQQTWVLNAHCPPLFAGRLPGRHDRHHRAVHPFGAVYGPEPSR